MLREVRLLPDPVLTRRAEPIGEIDDFALGVARDLLDTMRGTPHSVGVAAPQIGVGIRAFCVDVSGHRKADQCHGELLLLDPVILVAEGRELGREGCMSVPDLTGDVGRAMRLVVAGVTTAGEEQVLECEGFEARAVQHEMDHLDGHLFLDRVASAEHVFRRKRYR